MADMKYKLRVYIKSGGRKGDISHEEFFSTKKRMDERYKELFQYELYSLNPTAWISTRNGWIRIMGY